MRACCEIADDAQRALAELVVERRTHRVTSGFPRDVPECGLSW